MSTKTLRLRTENWPWPSINAGARASGLTVPHLWRIHKGKAGLGADSIAALLAGSGMSFDALFEVVDREKESTR